MKTYMWILSIGILLYRYIPPTSETNNLVLLSIDPNYVNLLKNSNFIRAVFKVEANIDSHMERGGSISDVNTKV